MAQQDPGLDLAFDVLSRRRNADPLTTLLEAGAALPEELLKLRRARAQRAAAGAMLRGGELPSGFEPESAEQALKFMQMRALRDRPEHALQLAVLRAQSGAQGLTPQEQELAEQAAGLAPGGLAGVRPQNLPRLGLVPKPLSKEAAETSTNLNSGLRALNRFRLTLSAPGGPRARLKAALPLSGLTTIGDPLAQQIRNDADEALDILKRARSGAALSNRETELYERRLLSPTSTLETVMDAANNLTHLFEETRTALTTGTIVPGAPRRAASAPQPVPQPRGQARLKDPFGGR